MKNKITFIGGGNMATSMVAGLIANQYPAENITVAEPDAERLNTLKQQYQINTNTENTPAAQQADIVILAVKPQILQTVCLQLATTIQDSTPLVLSIAAGIRSRDISRWLGGDCALVRCMPNTPALLQAGAAGLFANEQVSKEQRDSAEHIIRSTGSAVWVDEEPLLDAVTAVSGSGPAYFFLLMEAMQTAGEQMGLDSATAKQLSLQTALGAARMAVESDDEPASLRAKVTSKGGTTEAAIQYFQNHNFESLVNKALLSARDRAIELADNLGKDI